MFSDRRSACIGYGKPCGPYRASVWRRPAASSSAKSPACRDLSARAERWPAEDSWDCGSGNPEAADRPRRPRPAGSGWATDESRAAGQQDQDSDDRKDSTDFHGNVPSLNRTRAPDDCERGASLSWKRTSAAKLAKEGSETLVLFVLVLRNDDRSRRTEQIGEAGADGID